MKRAEKSTILWWPRLKAGPRLYLLCLSPWRLLLTSAPAQGNRNFHQGKTRGGEVKNPKSRASPLMLHFAVSQGIKRPGGRGGAYSEQVKAWQRAAVHSLLQYEQLRNPSRLVYSSCKDTFYLACAVCPRTHSQSSLYSISCVTSSAKKALIMEGVTLH